MELGQGNLTPTLSFEKERELAVPLLSKERLGEVIFVYKKTDPIEASFFSLGLCTLIRKAHKPKPFLLTSEPAKKNPKRVFLAEGICLILVLL